MKFYRLLCLSLILAYYQANAQFINNSGSGAFMATPGSHEHQRYDNLEGSPYLNDDWGKGVVQVKKGLTYTNLDIKFDQVLQLVVLKGADEKELYFAEPVTQFKIVYSYNGERHTSYFKSGFGDKKDEFYEVLAEGSVGLLKRTTKNIMGQMTYPMGSGSTRVVEVKDMYYLYVNNSLKLVKPNAESILDAIGDKQSVLLDYIANNKLNFKNDDDLTKLLIYYNSI